MMRKTMLRTEREAVAAECIRLSNVTRTLRELPKALVLGIVVSGKLAASCRAVARAVLREDPDYATLDLSRLEMGATSQQLFNERDKALIVRKMEPCVDLLHQFRVHFMPANQKVAVLCAAAELGSLDALQTLSNCFYAGKPVYMKAAARAVFVDPKPAVVAQFEAALADRILDVTPWLECVIGKELEGFEVLWGELLPPLLVQCERSYLRITAACRRTALFAVSWVRGTGLGHDVARMVGRRCYETRLSDPGSWMSAASV